MRVKTVKQASLQMPRVASGHSWPDQGGGIVVHSTYPTIKRLLDLGVSLSALTLCAPVVVWALALTWLSDRANPVYYARRIGLRGIPFTMFKIRTMGTDAEKSGVDSTAADDPRITSFGRFLRRFKLDELLQLVNVIKGDMSLVGPRPNVERETCYYTDLELTLLDVRPGVTDLSSIVFSDLGEILRSQPDANIAYRELVRPWKSRLGIIYARNASLGLDLKILACTGFSFFSRQMALKEIQRILTKLGADPVLIKVAGRTEPLVPHHPPGADDDLLPKREKTTDSLDVGLHIRKGYVVK